MKSFLSKSEFVTEGHPEKLCDIVSDAILDACLEQDPETEMTCDTCIGDNRVRVFGHIISTANVNYEQVVRKTCREIGFTSEHVGIDADNCEVITVDIKQKKPEGVHGQLHKRPEGVGANDNCNLFGYATDETPQRMSLTHVLATELGVKLAEVRKNGTCPWLMPYGETQVTVEYRNDGGEMVPHRVRTVVIYSQLDDTVDLDHIAADLIEHVVMPVIPEKYMDDEMKFFLNPTSEDLGKESPHEDAALAIDPYGRRRVDGGWTFSGKDPTQVNRSGEYILRQAAKSVVAEGLARRCLVHVSYASGVPEPLSMFVNTYGTGKIRDKDIIDIIKQNFDFRPGMIAMNLDLKRGGNGRFQKSTTYGHFGRDDPDFTWEVVKPLKWNPLRERRP